MSTPKKSPKEPESLDDILYEQTGYRWKDLTFDNLTRYMYRPSDPSSLGVVRMLFGLSMVLDVPEERGGAEMDLRWGDPMGCYFPLIPLKVLPLPYMAVVYGIMWIGAVGIFLGFKFKLSTIMFVIPYWYIFLLEKSYWNNHSYLYGLVGVLFIGTQANNYLSIDAYLNKSIKNKEVPYWNYFVLKYQCFILYFVAGLKKASEEWLSGYAMTNLGNHWVFFPFRIFLTVEQTDYIMIHWFAFIFDLSVCFWMIYGRTRAFAMTICVIFHLMNTRLFCIGMFPWVCLGTLPLFCSNDWPKSIIKNLKALLFLKPKKDTISSNENARKEDKNEEEVQENQDKESKDNQKVFNANSKQRGVVYCIVAYRAIHAFLPYSHFITKGYNNWTNGLYGYSWDMMVHNWDTILVLVKVVDNESKNEMFIDPDAWTPNDRWTKHGDMMHQYAQCLRNNLLKDSSKKHIVKKNTHNVKYDLIHFDDGDIQDDVAMTFFSNISIYVDVWCSMNGRFQQRMFNPNIDILKVNWSPFKSVEWLMPLLTELNNWREIISDIQEHVYSWNNYTDVLFVADFPGLHLENYISPDLFNVSLTVLEGRVFYEIPKKAKHITRLPEKSKAIHLTKDESILVESGAFHKIHTVGNKPACYMYVFMNSTKKLMEEDPNAIKDDEYSDTPKNLIVKEVSSKFNNMVTFLEHVGNGLLYSVYGVPMLRRVEVR